MLLSFCRRKLRQIPAGGIHGLSITLLKSISTRSNSVDPFLTVSYLINSCGLPPESATCASKAIRIKDTKKPNSVLEFFRAYGLSDAQITAVISAEPRCLRFNVEKTLKPKFEFLQGLGLSESDIICLVTSDPIVLMRGLETQIIPSMNFLMDLFHSTEILMKAFKRCRWMITDHVSNRMRSNIGTLKEYGFTDSQIAQITMLKPAILAQRKDSLEESVRRVDELGLKRSSGLFSMALLAMTSVKKSTWEAKLKVLKSVGWSEEEVLEALRRMPILINYSEKKIKAGMDFYVNELKWKPSEIARDPMYLMFSLEDRMIPRYRVWKMLKCKNLFEENEEKCLKLMLKAPEKKFLICYVTRFEDQIPGLLKAYKGTSSGVSI